MPCTKDKAGETGPGCHDGAHHDSKVNKGVGRRDWKSIATLVQIAHG